jgi:hypothetical protein
MSLPVTIVDNFFDNPNYVEKYGLSLEYFIPEGFIFPGKRSECLSVLDPILHSYINYKILSLFYNNLDTLSYSCNLRFQLIENNNYTGFIHQDTSLYTFIIYLTPETEINCGTSFYKPTINSLGIGNTSSLISKYSKIKHNVIKNNNITQQEQNEKKQIEDESYTKTLDVKDIYNRLLIFPSHLHHSANSLFSKLTPHRLTLVGFVYGLNTSNTPLYRSNTFII